MASKDPPDPWAKIKKGVAAPKEHPTPPPGHMGDVWQVTGRLDLLKRAIDLVTDSMPAVTHSILVEVIGGPRADIRRIWYLAVSAALGRYRTGIRTTLSPLSIAAMWDITGKAVSIELVYQNNKLTDLAISPLTVGLIPGVAGIGAAPYRFNDPTLGPIQFLMRGPEQVTVGAGWDSMLRADPRFAAPVERVPIVRNIRTPPAWLARLSGAPTYCLSGTSARGSGVQRSGIVELAGTGPNAVNPLREFPVIAGSRTGVSLYPYRVTFSATGGIPEPANTLVGLNTLPNLPDQNRIITTVEKLDVNIQPPKPPYDGHTRFGLLSLVAQALQNPCYLPSSPPCTNNTSGGSGRFIGNVGSPDPTIATLWDTQTKTGSVSPLAPGTGADGYTSPAILSNVTE